MDQARQDGLQVEANGSGLQAQQAGGASELIGVGIALVVLVLTFGSLVAAGLPLLTALVGVGIGTLSISAMTAFTDISSSTTGLATMIGLAVGIDYALFILARYRSELDVLGEERRAEAVGRAVGTAGSAVTFAGLTVIIALAALAVVRIPFMTAMGLGAAATVTVAVLVALTLLPALLGLFKSKAFAGRVRRYVPRRDDDGRVLNNGVRWARLVGRAPVITLLVVVAALGALAIPVKGLHLALPSDSTASSDTTARKAADLVTGSFGPGRQAPLLVVVDGRGIAAEDRGAAYGQVTAWASGLDDVANAQVVATNADEPGVQIMVTPQSAGDDARTEDLLTTMRDGQSEIEAEHRHHDGSDRADRHRERRVGATGLRPADLPGGRHRLGLPAADGGVPLHPGAADRDLRLPALGPGDPRRDRRRVPERRPRTDGGPADRQLHADLPDRCRLRPRDGLPGVPRDPHP